MIPYTALAGTPPPPQSQPPPNPHATKTPPGSNISIHSGSSSNSVHGTGEQRGSFSDPNENLRSRSSQSQAMTSPPRSGDQPPPLTSGNSQVPDPTATEEVESKTVTLMGLLLAFNLALVLPLLPFQGFFSPQLSPESSNPVSPWDPVHTILLIASHYLSLLMQRSLQ